MNDFDVIVVGGGNAFGGTWPGWKPCSDAGTCSWKSAAVTAVTPTRFFAYDDVGHRELCPELTDEQLDITDFELFNRPFFDACIV